MMPPLLLGSWSKWPEDADANSMLLQPRLDVWTPTEDEVSSLVLSLEANRRSTTNKWSSYITLPLIYASRQVGKHEQVKLRQERMGGGW